MFLIHNLIQVHNVAVSQDAGQSHKNKEEKRPANRHIVCHVFLVGLARNKRANRNWHVGQGYLVAWQDAVTYITSDAATMSQHEKSLECSDMTGADYNSNDNLDKHKHDHQMSLIQPERQ